MAAVVMVAAWAVARVAWVAWAVEEAEGGVEEGEEVLAVAAAAVAVKEMVDWVDGVVAVAAELESCLAPRVGMKVAVVKAAREATGVEVTVVAVAPVTAAVVREAGDVAVVV